MQLEQTPSRRGLRASSWAVWPSVVLAGFLGVGCTQVVAPDAATPPQQQPSLCPNGAPCDAGSVYQTLSVCDTVDGSTDPACASGPATHATWCRYDTDCPSTTPTCCPTAGQVISLYGLFSTCVAVCPNVPALDASTGE